MIRAENGIFVLDTPNTTYAFRVMDTGHLQHLFYGRHITLPSPLTESGVAALTGHPVFAPGNTIVYDSAHPGLSLESTPLELSSCGHGDIREPFVEISCADGGSTSDFVFESAAVESELIPLETLPCSYDETGTASLLRVTLREKVRRLTLELRYAVLEDCDVIVRSAVLKNTGDAPVVLRRLMSAQLDLPGNGYVCSTFTGAWAREMKKTDTQISAGKLVNASFTGTSSSRANPFVMLSRPGTDEDHGDCYGMNLIYSGNHYEALEVGAFGMTRFVSGINPQSFRFTLEQGGTFEAPEAVLTFSHRGMNAMSGQMHRFVREHIVRGVWKHRERPVLLNSWEAAYFQISERRLLALARAGKAAGIELLVLDDGWFGQRDDDTSSLGDWEVNRKKFPSGLDGLGRKIAELGLSFGIWVEPEMVSVNSRLYRTHPEYTMEQPGHPHSEGRNQRILDLSQTAVQDWLIEAMTGVFSQGNLSYVKWDMNRIVSDVFSQALPPERQGEVLHRYVMGLYRCMKTLTERFPDILFEGCASGGNRFDLGILCYFPQIWASDNTDAVCRAEMQTAYSYGYPMSVIGAHVSACPNHQTLRVTPLETRFQTAAFGLLGYEMNLSDLKREDFAAVRAQIDLYKLWRPVLQFGDFHRGRSGLTTEWTSVSPDGKKAVGFYLRTLAEPNPPEEIYYPRGLLPDCLYRFRNRPLTCSVKAFGDLINAVSPVHVRPDSLTQDVLARFVHLPGEIEDLSGFGDALMYGGVRLHPAFGGTGYNEKIRFFPDFSSRMYFMETI